MRLSTTIILIIAFSVGLATADFAILPNSGTFPVTISSTYKLSLDVTEIPLSAYWTLTYNTTGPAGGGIGLNNWAAASANLNAIQGTTFNVDSPVTAGKVRGQTTYTPNTNLNFGDLMRNNLYLKTPSALGTIVINMKFSNDTGAYKSVQYTVTLTNPSPAPSSHSVHIGWMLAMAILAVICGGIALF